MGDQKSLDDGILTKCCVDSKQLVRTAGIATQVGVCVLNQWNRALFTGNTPFARTVISNDSLSLKVPKSGCWKFSFTIVLPDKVADTTFVIEKRTTSLAIGGAVNPTVIGATNFLGYAFQLMKTYENLVAGEEIDFRFRIANCNHILRIEWTMEEMM